MMPGSHPIHVISDDKEQTSEAMARRDVRGAAVVALWPVHAGGVSDQGGSPAGPAGASGTMMAAWQTGQAVSVPALAVSLKMFWPQAGHEKLNSLMELPVH